MPQVTKASQEKAAAIQSRFGTGVKRVRGDATLSDAGKKAHLAKLYLEAKSEMAVLRREWSDSAEREATQLNRDLFGAQKVQGVDAISLRDANDRVSQLRSGKDAMALLEQAHASGDDVLARAIAQRAFRNRDDITSRDWRPVLDAYAEAVPEAMEKMTRLDAARQQGKQQNLEANFTFMLNRPTELNGVTNDTQMAKLASPQAEAVGSTSLVQW